MARLNLICNGMMLFDEIDDHTVQIVIPNISGHVRRFCKDPKPAQNVLEPLAVGAYSLSGPPPTATPLRDLINPDRYLVLKQGVVELDMAAAQPVSAIVRVPKPSYTRLFRASEPTGSVFGDTSTDTAFAIPTIHHDVVVFSYVDLPPDTVLTLERQTGGPLASVTTQADEIINWVLYSTEQAPLPGGSDPHATEFKTILKVDGQATDFSLSAIGLKDGPHSTGVGMSPHHMAAFHELPPTPMGSVIELESGDLGCSGAARAR